ncbi:hypothetical protein C0993_003539 [Termitomyces sp. T159_Od127]|nr:hypothetical protein C0993_003539 [Termitomyces sp. T159_Od127]
MSTPTTDAFLASTSFIACANLLLVQVQGLGAEAPHNKVEGMILEALVHKGLGLGEATGAGKGSWQEQGEEEKGTKEKTPKTTAGAAMGAAMPVARKASMGGAKGLASPAKKGSLTKLASKRRGHPTLRYKISDKQDFLDKELACLLVSRQAEVVVDMGVEVGVVLKKTKGKAMVDLTMRQAFKEEQRACDKCWADNNPEGCWYPVGAPPCFWHMAMKRSCILDGTKTHEHGNIPEPTVEKIKKSLVLQMCQDDESKRSGKSKRKASPPLSPADKEKKRARVVSPVAVTPEVESEDDEEDEVHCPAVAIEASKAVPGGEDLAGSSRQAEAPQDVGNQQKDVEQEEEAEVGLKVAPPAQPWSWKLLQWSWLPKWGTNDSATRNGSSGNEPKSWEPRRKVMARAAAFLKRMRAQAAQMEKLLVREREAVQVELMSLHL